MDNDIISRISTEIEELEKRIKSLGMQVTINTYNNVFKQCLDDIKALLEEFKEEIDDHIEDCEYLDDNITTNLQQCALALESFNQFSQDVSDLQTNVGLLQTAVSSLQTAVSSLQSTSTSMQTSIDSKVSKNTVSLSTASVYGQNVNNVEQMYQISPNAYGQFLIQRDSNGMFFVNEPTQYSHPASKNYVDNLCSGIVKSQAYTSYFAMITEINSLDDGHFKVGQNIYIQTVDVPDLWVYAVDSTSSSYTYTTDSDFVSSLINDGYVKVGYYKLSYLETNKVDLTNYLTTNTAQDITATKTFIGSQPLAVKYPNASNAFVINPDSNGMNVKLIFGNNTMLMLHNGAIQMYRSALAGSDNSLDLGSSSTYWKDLYLAGKTQYKNTSASGSATWQMYEDQYGQLSLERTYNGVTTKMFEFNGNTIKPVGSSGNLGSSSQNWGDLYLNGKVDFGDNATIIKDSSNRVVIKYGNNEKVKVGSVDTLFSNRVTPDSSNTYDLGRSGVYWRDLYMSGNISNGTRSVSITDIAKVQSLADEYDNTITYSTNEIVSYRGKLYTCDTAVTVAEDFDSTKWTEINMANYVQALVLTQIGSAITTALNTAV